VSFFFDLHVHSMISPCSVLAIEDILSQGRSLGLDGVCITDHNTAEAGNYFLEGMQDDGLCIIIGQEYSTPEGHFLIFGPFDGLPPFLPAWELLAHVQKTGGVAIASHPFRAMQKVDEELAAAGLIQFAEGINGRNSGRENALAQTWKEKYQVHLTGGSDAHSLEELGRVGTRFSQPVRSREDLITALLSKNFEPSFNPCYGKFRHWLKSLRLIRYCSQTM